MRRVAILWIFSIFLSFFAGLILTKQFPQIFDNFKAVVSGIKHRLTPPKTIKSFELNKEHSLEIVNANSFNLRVKTNESISIKDQTKNPQNINAGLYGEKKNSKIILKYFTRNGFEISNNYTKKHNLPKTYDPHNGKGGIRGVFFFNNESYALMSSKDIGCQYAAIINIQKSKEIFRTDCLVDLPSINYDGVGGASIHKKDKILLSIGTPSNNSERIRSLAQNKNSYFGKIISINKEELKKIDYTKKNNLINPKIFTLGHRNPQGLAEINNKFYSSEHGPKGGDEINLLNENANYGWPISSYGTKYYLEPGNEYNYGEKITKFYKNSHSKYGFEEPLFQFTPSIAISAITNCPKILQEYYSRNGCLISTSLKDKSLYIFILDEKKNERLVGFEKINLKKRLRNFALNHNGRLFENKDTIYVSTDDGHVLEIRFDL